MHDKIRPEVQALADRGNVTLDEWKAFRGNSWEMELIASHLTDEAYIYYAKHILANCYLDRTRPFVSYNTAAIGLVAPELVRRLQRRLDGSS